MTTVTILTITPSTGTTNLPMTIQVSPWVETVLKNRPVLSESFMDNIILTSYPFVCVDTPIAITYTIAFKSEPDFFDFLPQNI